MIDSNQLKQDFPVLRQTVNGKPLVYLDSTATSQKPRAVIDAVRTCYEEYYANVHRGIYSLSERASDAYEAVREKVARFINAPDQAEIIFTRNATESLNLLAYTWGQQYVKAGDEIVVTEMEHHANILPWRQLAERVGATVRYLPLTPDGRLDEMAWPRFITRKTKLLAVTHMSNVLGTVNPVARLIAAAKRINPSVVTVVDGAQSVPHLPINVQALGADFFAFSSHKMLGPAGVGVLWGRRALLEAMPPFMTGGDMITRVTFTDATWNEVPYKFEAGTPNIAGVIGLGAAIDYLQALGMEAVWQHEQRLTQKALEAFRGLEGATVYGPPAADDRGAIIAFTLQGVHPHDIASILDEQAICVRAGHHCAQPLHEKLGLDATARASFYLYNTEADLEALVSGLRQAQELFH